MFKATNLRLLFGAAAAAMLAWACERPESPVSNSSKPLFWFGEQCPAAKMTGGGRIDAPYGGPDKNPPESHLYETFGAHVISNGLQNGVCAVKGQLEWVDHREAMRINGSPLNLHSEQITFVEQLLTGSDCKDGALHWGGRLVVRNTGEEYDFEVFDCDNGEPGARNDGFNIALSNGSGEGSLNGYTMACPDPPSIHENNICTLTGGNRQYHPTH